MQRELAKKEEEEARKEEELEQEKEEETIRGEAEKELEKSDITEERPAEKKKFSIKGILLKYSPGAVPAMISILFFLTGQFAWAMLFVGISFVLILIHENFMPGTVIYLLAGMYYGFWQRQMFLSLILVAVYVLCRIEKFMKYTFVKG